ncbi:type II secretion system protein [Acinetobacter sp. KS-LM10]|uniref:type II secretion system protein n=1 Tax=Acinetobacter sp. KS-LM10 TaxID=3120518 RepID=UPI0030CAB794
MMNGRLAQKHQGFTLIELMVVIVIISIMASLVVMNLGGVDQRKAMQTREMLIMDLKRINREANDQSRIFALVVKPATDVATFQYAIQEYRSQATSSPSTNNGQINLASGSNQSVQASLSKSKQWVELDDSYTKTLPQAVSFSLESEQHDFKRANNSELVGGDSPKLIWLGNGEVKPVRIQMYFQQKPVGELIQIDYLGNVHENS